MNPSGTNIPGTISSGGTTPGGISSVPPAPGMVPPAPITSGGGDIVLSNEPEKKSKKGLIIGGIVAVLFIVGGLIAVALFTNQSKTIKPGTAQSEFNRYANLLINGEDSTKELKENNDESGEEGKPVIYSMIYSEEEEGEEEGGGEEAALYMQQLKGLWDGFVSKMGNFSLSNGLTKDDYENRIKFLITYANSEDKMSVDLVFEMADTKSLDDIKSAIGNYAVLFSNYNFSEAQLYASDAKNFYENVAEMAFKLRDAGCTTNSSEVMTCPEETYNGIVAEYESAFSFQDDMSDAVVSVVDYLVKNCWNINEAILGNEEAAKGGNE